MKKRFNKLASVLICITFTIFLLFIKDNVGYIWDFICTVATVLTPIVYGFGIAYVLSFPYLFLHNKVFGRIKKKWFQKFNKPLSLILTYVIVIGLVSYLFANLIPQLSESISGLFTDFPSIIKSFKENSAATIQWLSSFGIDTTPYLDINNTIANHLSEFFNIENFNDLSGVLINASFSTVKFFYNWIIGLIISVYMLASKDFLISQVKRFLTAFLPTKVMPTLYEIVRVTDDKCGKFLVGKVLDSTIIALLCFICMTLLNLPYALLISVIVGICNIIPFFGPFIGGIPSALLLLIIDPWACLKFVIMIFILQQIDGNLIGPKVVGSQVGLAGFWSLFSVIVAGGLFGVEGMILGTPIFAAIYTILGKIVKSRIAAKGDNATRVLSMHMGNDTKLTNFSSGNKRKKEKEKPENSESDDSKEDK